MFYIDDEIKSGKAKSGYGDKTSDEISADLMRIMQDGFVKNTDDMLNISNDGKSGKSDSKQNVGGTFPTKEKKGGHVGSSGKSQFGKSKMPHVEKLVDKKVPRGSKRAALESKKKGGGDGIAFQNVSDKDGSDGSEGEFSDSDDLEEEDLGSESEGEGEGNEVKYMEDNEKGSELQRKKKFIRRANKGSLGRKLAEIDNSSSDEDGGKTPDTVIGVNEDGNKVLKKKKSPKKIALYPVPIDEDLVKCHIIRDKGKFKLFPKYFLFAERGDGDVFLMAAKKRGQNKTSNYCITTDQKNIGRKSEHYVGKLRSNVLGTRFYIFDKGEREQLSNKRTPVRKQLGAIMYDANILGTRGPRKMTVIIPRVTEDGKYFKFVDRKDNKLIDLYQKKGDWQDIHIFKNKGPSWNEGLKAYVLNFSGRVTKPSVKNFQLVDPQNKETIQLQFGRVSDNKFTLDFRYPMSPFQAFAVALSAFDMKLACE